MRISLKFGFFAGHRVFSDKNCSCLSSIVFHQKESTCGKESTAQETPQSRDRMVIPDLATNEELARLLEMAADRTTAGLPQKSDTL